VHSQCIKPGRVLDAKNGVLAILDQTYLRIVYTPMLQHVMTCLSEALHLDIRVLLKKVCRIFSLH
jgi:hypothetical protein